MSNSSIVVTTTGDKLQTYENDLGAGQVHSEAVTPTDPNGVPYGPGNPQRTADDYSVVEYLDDQSSTGTVLTFTFSAAVQKAWVMLIAANAEDFTTARVRVDGTAPTATRGSLIYAGQNTPFDVPNGTEVKVLVTSGKTISIYGYRR